MTNVNLALEDSRRLTGPNLFGSQVGAVIDVTIFEAANVRIKDTLIESPLIAKKLAISTWQKHIKFLLNAVGWHQEKKRVRQYYSGASLMFSAPIDCLYAATEINEAAWQLTVDELQKKIIISPAEIKVIVNRLINEIKKEQNPALVAMHKAALEHNVVFLSDDDEVSIGYGKTCQIFPVTNIPHVDTINWDEVKDIPVALVTGTNGKSTTVRLASSVVNAAGKRCGITSTDYIRVGNEIIDHGDYSGPGGARTLLRHPKTEVAFLEVARGGMLRRGIGINQASAALITNVSEDHLGEYGINSLDDMVEAKFIVRQIINGNQDLILNADDKGCVNFAKQLNNSIIWFSWTKENPIIQAQIKKHLPVCYVNNDNIYFHSNSSEQKILSVKEIPITLGGAAKHNIHNALGVVALSFSLGFKLQDIQSGLKDFSSSPIDNPGRGNLFEINGFKVILDFAHNEQGLSRMAETMNNMPAKRRLVLLCQAGDRQDSLIKGLVKSALKSNPDILLICELEEYLRGRKLGEVPTLIHQFAKEFGMKESQIVHASDTVEGTKKALEWAEKEDLILLLALDHRDEILEMLSLQSDC
jgi:cyanophycin synthetase